MNDSYKVVIERRAWHSIMALSEKLQARIFRAIEHLEVAPHPPQSKPLVGEENVYRLRVGNYRVFYRIEGGELLILIIDVGHRSQVYKDKS